MTHYSNKVLALASLAGAMLLGLTACTTASQPPVTPSVSTKNPADYSGDITLWHFFDGSEANVIQTAVDGFRKIYPNIKVTVMPGQDDDQMRADIAAGQAADVAITYSSDQIGHLCSSGDFIDLAPYISHDNVDMGQIPSVVQSYTKYDGVQCALPMLADVTGLFYNKDLFDAAGIAGPPQTLAELAADAKALTTHNRDGSIKVLGFMPFMEYYENNPANLAVMAGAQWLTADGSASAVSSDPAWKTLLNWQKKLIKDLGGNKALSKWAAKSGDEFSDQNDFETGYVAMQIDGEWRIPYINDEAPDLNYGTAPLPASSPDKYGAGRVEGNIIGIPRGSANPDLAWQLVKYLAMDVDAQVQMGNGLMSVPTIMSAVNSPDLMTSSQYQTFLDAFCNPDSVTEPRTAAGTDYVGVMAAFMSDWESGDVANLAKGLANVDEQIDSMLGGDG